MFRIFSWGLALLATNLSLAHAGELQDRLDDFRAKKAVNTPVSPGQLAPLNSRRVTVVALAQTNPNAPPSRRPISVFVDVGLGFDSQTAATTGPTPIVVDVRRRIRVVNLSAEYPLASRTRLAFNVPYISQSARFRDLNNPGSPVLTARGSGVGDISAFIEQTNRETLRGSQTAIGLGVTAPTGKDPFEAGAGELPTGNGFYQGVARVSWRRLAVPLQFYISGYYSKALSRTIGGQKVSQPDSYGAQTGFGYALGPQYAVQTGLSASKLTTPLLLGQGQSVAYLTQSLTYHNGQNTQLRASADVGLTDDSTDLFLSLLLRREF